MFGSLGSMRIALVECVSRRPAYCHVLPASVDLKSPSPGITVLRMSASPVPTYRILGLEGATAIAPMLALGPDSLPSEMFSHSAPSVLFQTPPPTVPA